MDVNKLPLSFQEKVVFSLRGLYDSYGYRRYKMNKFEEYDLYARNKDFLISDHVITFTDTNGKLMALKPDVTLSIVQKSKDTANVQKLYYNENVYRVAKGTQAFREIMQVGLECMGVIDDYCISEVLLLAAKSLASISDTCVLSISHVGLLSSVFEALGITGESKAKLFCYVGEKNFHEAEGICNSLGLSADRISLIKELISINGTAAQVLPKLKTLLNGLVDSEMLSMLENVLSVYSGTDLEEMIRLDFSVVDNIHYYNGFVFKGFISGVPGSVLSGGQYDKLMQKMNRKSGAIGFAIYMDMLEHLAVQQNQYDVDTVLLYDESANAAAINRAIEKLCADGFGVLALRALPEDLRYRRLMKLADNEVIPLEQNA